MKKPCDPELKTQAVEKLIEDLDVQSYKVRIEYSQDAYEAIKKQINEEEAKNEFIEKKFEENIQFLSEIIDAEITENFLTLYMLEYQYQLKTETADEMERLITQIVDEQKRIQQMNTEQLTQEEKASFNRMALETLHTLLAKTEFEIEKLNKIINVSVETWGGKSWSEGQTKQAEKLSSDFGSGFKEIIGFNNKTESEKSAIQGAINTCQTELKQELAKMADPETVQTKLRESYEKANATPQTNATPQAPSLEIKIPPPKSHIIGHTAVMAELTCFNMAKKLHSALVKLFPHDESLKKMSIKALVKNAASQESLTEYQEKLSGYSKLCDLNKEKKELQSVVDKLITLAETKTVNANPRMSK